MNDPLLVKFICLVSSYVQIRFKVEIKSVLLGFRNVKASSLHSVEYQRCTTSGCKAIEIGRIVLVASNQFFIKICFAFNFYFLLFAMNVWRVCIYLSSI